MGARVCPDIVISVARLGLPTVLIRLSGDRPLTTLARGPGGVPPWWNGCLVDSSAYVSPMAVPALESGSCWITKRSCTLLPAPTSPPGFVVDMQRR